MLNCARLNRPGGGWFDADTMASAGSWNAALHAAGGACAMVDATYVDIARAMRSLLGDDNVFIKPFAVGELLSRVGEVTGGPDS